MTEITVEQFNCFMENELPWAYGIGMRAHTIGDREVIIKLEVTEDMLRPGGTVSGPFMMAMADAAMYAVVMSKMGAAKMAVTTSLNINFLQRPSCSVLLAKGRALKVGKRLAVIDVTIQSEANDGLIAHATGTYSLPPAKT